MLELGQARLKLKGLPLGRYRILEASEAAPIAEVHLTEPAGVDLALPKARYLILHSRGRTGLASHADLRRAGPI